MVGTAHQAGQVRLRPPRRGTERGRRSRRAGLGHLRRDPLQAAQGPSVELVGLFDEYLLGYASRDLVVAKKFAKRIQAGGFVKPAVLLDGRVVGTWKQKRTAKKVTVEVEPFEKVSAVESHIESAVVDVGRFLGRDAELRLGRPG